MEKQMEITEVYEVIDILKQFGIYIYTGHRYSDYILIQMELEELYKSGVIPQRTYLESMVVMNRNIAKLKNKQEIREKFL